MVNGRTPLRVLVTTSTLPIRESGGQARFVLDLAQAIASTDVEVTILAPHSPFAPRRERLGDVAVRRFRYFIPASLQRLAYGPGMRENLRRSRLARFQVPFFMLSSTLAVVWTALKLKADVVNAHWLVPQGLAAALGLRPFGIPIVLHVHAADVYMLGSARWGRPIARFVVSSSATVFADGSHVRDSLDRLLGYESKAVLRPMGVWVDQFQGGQALDRPDGLPDRYIVFVGRLVEKKGVEFLIRAMPLVRELMPELELVIVGDGPLREPLSNLAQHQGMSPVIHFLGALNHDEVARLMRGADVVCVPSIVDSKGETEGMPTVVLEAMAAGARVVGSAVDGIPDVIRDTANGWLVEQKNPQALADGIVRALAASSGSRITAAATTTAASHDWRNVGDEYELALRVAAGR